MDRRISRFVLLQIQVNISDGFSISTYLEENTTHDCVFVSVVDGSFACHPVRLAQSETHKVFLKFNVPAGTVYGDVYIFKKTSSRGILIFHESAKMALSAAGDRECVCSRLRVSKDHGTIGLSRTLYSYIVGHPYEQEVRGAAVMTDVTNTPRVEDGCRDASIFDKYVAMLEKMESDPVKLAQDIAYLSSILRVPDEIHRRYQRHLVDRVQQHGGDIQGVIDVYERASRISTMMSMVQ